MHKIQEALNDLCMSVCRDICKHSAEVDNRNLLNAKHEMAMDDEEFDAFIEAHCEKCPINEIYWE